MSLIRPGLQAKRRGSTGSPSVYNIRKYHWLAITTLASAR
jgi:hypothetical protein